MYCLISFCKYIALRAIVFGYNLHLTLRRDLFPVRLLTICSGANREIFPGLQRCNLSEVVSFNSIPH